MIPKQPIVQFSVEEKIENLSNPAQPAHPKHSTHSTQPKHPTHPTQQHLPSQNKVVNRVIIDSSDDSSNDEDPIIKPDNNSDDSSDESIDENDDDTISDSSEDEVIIKKKANNLKQVEVKEEQIKSEKKNSNKPDWICSVCSEPDQHPMIIIKCGHSFCEECLLKLPYCPQCRVTYDKYDLQTNYALLSESMRDKLPVSSINDRIDQVLGKRESLVNTRVDRIVSQILDIIVEKTTTDPLIETMAIPFYRGVNRPILIKAKEKLESKGFKILIGECLSIRQMLDSFILTVILPKLCNDTNGDEEKVSLYYTGGLI